MILIYVRIRQCNWSYIAYFLTLGVADYGTGVLLGRVDGGFTWVDGTYGANV